MTAGYPVTKADLDNRMGGAIVALRDALRDVVSLKAMLDDSALLPDATLTQLGYSAGEITTIRASFADLVKLNDISRAAATQPAVNDFWFNAKRLCGLNFR